MGSLAAKQVAEEVLGTIGRGKIPNITKIAVKKGYSHKTANAGLVQRTKTFRDLMEKHLSDAKLSALHKKFLEKKEVIVVSDGARAGSHLEWTGQPHSDALKALDTAYKLKGRYSDPQGGNVNVQINVLNFGSNDSAQVPTTPVSTQGA